MICTSIAFAVGEQIDNFSLGICRVFYEQVSQVTCLSRQESEMNSPVLIRLQYRMFDYDFMVVISPVNLQESGDYVHMSINRVTGVAGVAERR